MVDRLSRAIVYYENIIYTIFPRKDVAATIYFSANAMRCLFKSGTY